MPGIEPASSWALCEVLNPLRHDGNFRYILSIVIWFRSTKGEIQTRSHILSLENVTLVNIPLSQVTPRHWEAASSHLNSTAWVWMHNPIAEEWSLWANDSIYDTCLLGHLCKTHSLSPQSPLKFPFIWHQAQNSWNCNPYYWNLKSTYELQLCLHTLSTELMENCTRN